MNIGFDYQTQLNNPDWNVVKGFLGNGLSKNFANIQVGYETQHHTDDTHGDVTADSLVVAGLTTIQAGLSANGSPGSAGQILTAGGNTANAYWATLGALGNVVVNGTLTANGAVILKSTLSANGSTGSLYQVLGANSTANAYWTMGASGTWTPVDNSGASLVFTSVSATYLRLGGLVFVNAQLTYPSTASGAGSLIGGLPFTEASGVASGLTIAQSPLANLTAELVAGTKLVEFLVTGVSVPNSTMSLGTFYFSGIYRAA